MPEASRVSMSVVIPCLNSGATLRGLLDSLQRQTLSGDQYEIRVVDDGSADDTCRIAESYAGVVIHRQCGRGGGAARGLGTSLARGALVLYLDSDTWAAADLLERHLRYHQAHPQAAATGGSVMPGRAYRMMSWPMVDHLSSWFNCNPSTRYEGSPEYLPSLNLCIKKDLVWDRHQVQWPDGLAHSGEDVIFCHDMRRKGLTLAFIPDAAVYHHDRPTLRSYLRHMYRWGQHAPHVRGQFRTLKYSVLFPRSRLKLAFTLPLIVLGYTALICAGWLRARPLAVLMCLPQIFLGRLAYAAGVWASTSKLIRAQQAIS